MPGASPGWSRLSYLGERSRSDERQLAESVCYPARMASVAHRMRTIHFLIAYDHDTRSQVVMKEFTNGARAFEAYGDLEREYEDRPRVEVVLLGADSEKAIRVTHPNYFDDQPFEELLKLAR